MATKQTTRTVAQNRRLHWLFGQLNISGEAIEEIAASYSDGRTTHTIELTGKECDMLIGDLQKMLDKRRLSRSENIEVNGTDAARATLDRKRKKVIGAIFRWFELRGQKPTMDYVKAVACRAAGAESFNKISPEALNRIYHEFSRKQKVQREMQMNDFTIINN